ncbi:MAG: glycine cleavage system aminomethyltransferase T [Parasphingorhabdus sp.]
MNYSISPSPRIRRSPFYDATVEDGVQSFSPYNRMLMPTSYGHPDEEYRRIIDGVSMWDVAVERQVELNGPDAMRLAQVLSPRKLDGLKVGLGWYIPICDHRGTIINDPILLKHSDNKLWFSIADGDLMLWARAIAAERGFDVEVFEPDVSPLAIQGPQAENVVADLLGESVRSIRHFWFRDMMLDDIPLVVARSGWSHQGGFELYLTDGSKGYELWQRVKQAGQPYGIGPGNPNSKERVESGLLSWGGDTDDDTNPFEVRLGRYIDLDAPDEVVGIQALRAIHATGIKRHQLGVFINREGQIVYSDQPSLIYKGDVMVGKVTAQCWSPRLQRNIGLTLLSIDANIGDQVKVKMPDGVTVAGELTDLPFLSAGRPA